MAQGLRRKAEVLQYHKDNIEAELGRLRDACSRRGEHNDLMKLKLVVRAPHPRHRHKGCAL